MIGETDQLFNEYSTGNTEISIANCIKMHTKYAYIYIYKKKGIGLFPFHGKKNRQRNKGERPNKNKIIPVPSFRFAPPSCFRRARCLGSTPP